MTNRYHSAPVGGAGYFGTFDGDQELSDQDTIARLNEQARTIAELHAELLTRAEKDAEDTHRLQRYCDGIHADLHEARGHIAALIGELGAAIAWIEERGQPSEVYAPTAKQITPQLEQVYVAARAFLRGAT